MLRECQKGNILKTEVVCVSKLFIGCPKFVKFVKKSEEKYTEAAASDWKRNPIIFSFSCRLFFTSTSFTKMVMVRYFDNDKQDNVT